MKHTYTLVSCGYQNAHVYVETDVNHHKFNLIVDTGSDCCHLIPYALEKLGHIPEDQVQDGINDTAGGGVPNYVVEDNFEIMGKTVDSVTVFLNPLPSNIHGILGLTVINQFKRVTFDLEHKQLILED